jgi:hypothetical protein
MIFMVDPHSGNAAGAVYADIPVAHACVAVATAIKICETTTSNWAI